jgi:hypothetical protein
MRQRRRTLPPAQPPPQIHTQASHQIARGSQNQYGARQKCRGHRSTISGPRAVGERGAGSMFSSRISDSTESSGCCSELNSLVSTSTAGNKFCCRTSPNYVSNWRGLSCIRDWGARSWHWSSGDTRFTQPNPFPNHFVNSPFQRLFPISQFCKMLT